jgi:hypothetical protein
MAMDHDPVDTGVPHHHPVWFRDLVSLPNAIPQTIVLPGPTAYQVERRPDGGQQPARGVNISLDADMDIRSGYPIDSTDHKM